MSSSGGITLKVSIIGAGAVGKATGIGLSQVGHYVIFYDIAESRRKELQAEGYSIAENLDAVNGCDVHIICVPTPVPNGVMDFSIVESAVIGLARVMTGQDKYQVIAIRSTILPLTVKERIIPLLGHHCSLKLGEQYGICHNPEFLREAYALEDFLDPPIIVIGADDERSAGIMKQLYAPFKAPLLITTTGNAEAIKFFSNVYNVTKVSFFNEMYLIAKRLGLDHEVISQALTKSSLGVRIPEYYTKGGYPFAGHCLPKDLAAFITFLKELGFDPVFYKEVVKINEEMKRLGKVE
jgi:UDPglucose 6-dehydrogenase